MKFWKQDLSTKVASSFLLLSLVAVGVVGGFAFVKAREALKQAAFERLSVTATLKEEEITRWFEDQRRDFLLTTQFPDVQANLKIILDNDTSDTKYQNAYTVLSKYLLKVADLKPNFKEIFILNRSNRIILSTDKTHEGQYEILGNITYVKQVELGDSFAPIFYPSPVTGKPSVTLATPLYNEARVHQGLILAHLNLDRIDSIVRENTGLGKSGETYLVGSLVTKNTFISKKQANMQDFPDGVSSQGIDKAMGGIRGQGLYKNYARVPVIGVYRWLNDRDLALLVEMHQEEAFAPASDLAQTIVLVGLASVGFLKPFSEEEVFARVENNLIIQRLQKQLTEQNLRLQKEIRERQKTESVLRLSQFYLDKFRDLVFFIDSEARFVYGNEAACRTLGYSSEQLLTMTVHDIDPNFQAVVWRSHWQELRDKNSFTFKSSHKTKDGREISVEITAHYIEFNDQEYICTNVRQISA
ncbi:MAG: cache domain-containing protein [Rhizonema sp. PD38]|nr:cache domain-containing protein [Rhizonema sp. PD38]